MQEFIAQEKARLQALFEEFNRDGSFIVMREGRGEPLPLGLVDSYTVTRVAPHFDSQGNVIGINTAIISPFPFNPLSNNRTNNTRPQTE